MSREEDTQKISSAPVEVETESAKMGPPPPPKDVEKQEEEKLKAKYPNLKKMGGGSALLNKRLQKGSVLLDPGVSKLSRERCAEKPKDVPAWKFWSFQIVGHQAKIIGASYTLRAKQKYFDSGDYNMAKAKLNNPKKPLAPSEKMLLQESIGDAIPTPEVLPPRKASITTSKLATDSTS